MIEPTVSGLHDARRVIKLVESFKVPIFVIVNKYDINSETSSEVERYLKEISVPVLGRIPFDTHMVESMVNEMTILEFDSLNPLNRELENIWAKLEFILKENSNQK